MARTNFVAGDTLEAAQLNSTFDWAACEAHCAKAAVRVATTANGTLASAFENGDTVDGVTLATGDRILLKNQTDATQNGIYTVNASGAPTRAVDMDTDAKVANGAIILVKEGSSNAGKAFFLSNSGSVVIGSTSLTFAQFGGAGGSTPTGTGFRHVTSGTEDAATKLVENADVSATAAIAESKIAFTDDAAAGTASRRTLGTGAQQAAAGNHSHSAATTSVAGFMSAADKLKLDNSTAAATASTLALRDSNARLKVATPSAGTDAANKDYVDGVMAAGASDADDVTKGISYLSVAPDTDPIAVGDNDPRVEVFGASGVGHSAGIVPDPGSTAGSSRYLREDGTWAEPPGTGGGTGGGIEPIEVAQTAHGFSVGDHIRVVSSDTYDLAQADDADNAEVCGEVTVVDDVDHFTYRPIGPVVDHTGTAGLVEWLDPTTPGATTTTKPSTPGQIARPVLLPINTTQAILLHYPGYEVGIETLASEAEAEAGTDNGKIMTPLRTAQAIAALAPTGGAYVGASVRRTSTAQTIADSVASAVAYNSEDWDTDGFHDNSTNNSRLTIPSGLDGTYEVKCHVYAGGAGTDTIRAYIRLNATNNYCIDVVPLLAHPLAGINAGAYKANVDLELVAGDFLEVMVDNETGASIDIAASSGSGQFQIRKIA